MHILQKDWFKTFIPAWKRSLNILFPPVWSRHRLLQVQISWVGQSTTTWIQGNRSGSWPGDVWCSRTYWQYPRRLEWVYDHYNTDHTIHKVSISNQMTDVAKSFTILVSRRQIWFIWRNVCWGNCLNSSHYTNKNQIEVRSINNSY